MTTITMSPWGEVHQETTISEGITFVSTDGHGGFFLDAERNAVVPEAHRRASFNGLANDGWYEWDCDWCLVVLAFPDKFNDHDIARASETFDGWIKPKL